LCATLHHPNIVQVLDFGRFRGAFMLAMEYVDGVSLSKLLRARGGPLELPAVALLGAEIAAALDYIHSRRSARGAPLGLVHCDVNPPNVLVSRLGEVKLADFGIARAMGHLELDGHFHGKPAYAAPEQTFGTPLDGRTDLFALGITLHEAVTGKRLFAGMVDFASLLDVPSPSLVRPIPKGLEDVIMSLLEIEPERRPRSAGEVRDALLALGGECAPYPDGERLLASAVESCLDEVVGDRPGDATTRAEVTQGGGAPTSIHSRS
jgi:serine/threonine-protein kinase